jgi:DMSO reductase family type II enzyme heme b subunit
MLETAGPESAGQAQLAPQDGTKLYLQHCSACHGERGDGQGVAAAYLFPKPRNLRSGKFRLVSTDNNVPSFEDLDSVLVRGMPGSAMPPWAHLGEAKRKLLIEEVMRLRVEGAREQYVLILREEEEMTDEEIAEPDMQQEIQEFVVARTTPGVSTTLPAIGPADDAAIARGKDIYVKQSCHSCHGDDGKGDGVTEQVDDDGYPTSPRDYTRGIFKGGHDPASLYRRIAYGMPGTPMPSSANLTPDQTVDLVHFLRSMSDEPTRQAAILRREKLVAKSVKQLPQQQDQWSSCQPVGLRMVPLWWRDDADPELEVQAVHDGKTIAFRLSWRDEAANRHAAKSEAFEDAVALELYRGDAEPFIGMGDPNVPVDVWFWDADRQGSVASVADVYPNTVVDVFPFSETAVASAELNRPGATTGDQPDISLPARASGNLIMPSGGESGASTLTVGGPGSVTFRLPKSQLVHAVGQWKDGRWAVVMTRSLEVRSESDGVSLKPGSGASIAFAIWDGALQDRDGKKLITIWQDLVLE